MSGRVQTVVTNSAGRFRFSNIVPATYAIAVDVNGRHLRSTQPRLLTAQPPNVVLTTSDSNTLLLVTEDSHIAKNGGGKQLSSSAVSEIPLNKRDFSALLLLAVGTSTDANGTNFTPQFAINGQRGVEATFAMDNAETSDPEMGGSTFPTSTSMRYKP